MSVSHYTLVPVHLLQEMHPSRHPSKREWRPKVPSAKRRESPPPFPKAFKVSKAPKTITIINSPKIQWRLPVLYKVYRKIVPWTHRLNRGMVWTCDTAWVCAHPKWLWEACLEICLSKDSGILSVFLAGAIRALLQRETRVQRVGGTAWGPKPFHAACDFFLIWILLKSPQYDKALLNNFRESFPELSLGVLWGSSPLERYQFWLWQHFWSIKCSNADVSIRLDFQRERARIVSETPKKLEGKYVLLSGLLEDRKDGKQKPQCLQNVLIRNIPNDSALMEGQ